MVGTVGPSSLALETVSQFDSRLLDPSNRREWQLSYLAEEVRQGLELVATRKPSVESVGIDGTAAGFGFLADGKPICNPARWGVARPAHASAWAAFERLGHWRLPVTYYYLAQSCPDVIERADTLLLAPQLLAYVLGGDPVGESTYAVSAGLGSSFTGTWATDLLADWGLRIDLLPSMADHGAAIGQLVDHPFDSPPAIRVVAGHDTSSAVLAVPFTTEDSVFLSTGSWFVPGIELDEPVVSRAVFEAGAETLRGVGEKYHLVRNLPGFSILERWRRDREQAGVEMSYERLLAAAAVAEPCRTLVATSDDRLRGENGSVDDGLAAYARATGQPIPSSDGAVTRCLLESLAVECAVVLDDLCDLAAVSPSRLYLVGGGARNDLLCRFVAEATNLPVIAGAPAAASIGNVLVQAMGAGTLSSIAAGRALVEDNVAFSRFVPDQQSRWGTARQRMRRLLAEAEPA